MRRDFNLYSHCSEQFEQRAEKPLLLETTGKIWRYADIEAESSRLANFLRGLGIGPGNRVSVQVKKSPQALALYLACLRAGLVFHPLNTDYQASELDYFLGDAEPTAVVCDSNKLETIAPLTKAKKIPHLLTLNANGQGTLIEHSRQQSTGFDTVSRSPGDLAALLYSSGTTGVPKGIMLSHQNLLDNATTLVSTWGFTAQDRLLHTLPIYHVHGLFIAIHCVLLSGASMRWLPTFDAAEVIRYMPECTVMMGVPTYYTRLLANATFSHGVSAKMRLFISGSAPLLEETFTAFEKRTGHRILERYGMSETGMNTSNPLEGERKPGTVGPPLPGVETRVADENGKTLPHGEIGNLQVRGKNVFQGYWKMPEKTAQDFTEDGYFNTGDKGLIDADGYIVIVGRAKDMVISGGLNIYPKEIEQLIDKLPGVVESAVIGVPHPDFGEAVVAIVVPGPGAEKLSEVSIIAALKNTIAAFKIPKRVVIAKQLPRNAMGKVQKNLLRQRYAGLLSPS